MFAFASRLLAAKAASKAATKVLNKAVDEAVSRADHKRHPHRTRRTATSSAVPSLLVGGVLMFLFDPKQGSARRDALKAKLSGRIPPAPSVTDIQARSRQVIDIATQKAKRDDETNPTGTPTSDSN